MTIAHAFMKLVTLFLTQAFDKNKSVLEYIVKFPACYGSKFGPKGYGYGGGAGALQTN